MTDPTGEDEYDVDLKLAQHRAATARSWAVLLMNDLAWLVGAAQQSGIDVPTRITDDLQEAVSWLAGD